MEEQFVSFETAKLAKQKKYPQMDYLSYVLPDDKNKYPYLTGIHPCHFNSKKVFHAPTQTLLQRWLREIHGIHIVIIPTVTSFWTYKTVTVISERDDDVIKGIKSVSDLPPYKEVCGYDFNTYEDALEYALFESLKLI